MYLLRSAENQATNVIVSFLYCKWRCADLIYERQSNEFNTKAKSRKPLKVWEARLEQIQKS